MKVKVTIEQRRYAKLEIEAENVDAAGDEVAAMLDEGTLPPVEWKVHDEYVVSTEGI
jgi:hypothetical protein